MGMSLIPRHKELEVESARLKRIYREERRKLEIEMEEAFKRKRWEYLADESPTGGSLGTYRSS